jgi:hypothetical protein
VAGSVVERHSFGPKTRRFDHDGNSLVSRIQPHPRMSEGPPRDLRRSWQVDNLQNIW